MQQPVGRPHGGTGCERPPCSPPCWQPSLALEAQQEDLLALAARGLGPVPGHLGEVAAQLQRGGHVGGRGRVDARQQAQPARQPAPGKQGRRGRLPWPAGLPPWLSAPPAQTLGCLARRGSGVGGACSSQAGMALAAICQVPRSRCQHVCMHAGRNAPQSQPSSSPATVQRHACRPSSAPCSSPAAQRATSPAPCSSFMTSDPPGLSTPRRPAGLFGSACSPASSPPVAMPHAVRASSRLLHASATELPSVQWHLGTAQQGGRGVLAALQLQACWPSTPLRGHAADQLAVAASWPSTAQAQELPLHSAPWPALTCRTAPRRTRRARAPPKTRAPAAARPPAGAADVVAGGGRGGIPVVHQQARRVQRPCGTACQTAGQRPQGTPARSLQPERPPPGQPARLHNGHAVIAELVWPLGLLPGRRLGD